MINVDRCLGRGCEVIAALAQDMDQSGINRAVEQASCGMETYCAPANGERETCGADPRSQHVLNALAIGIKYGKEKAQAPQPVNPESTTV